MNRNVLITGCSTGIGRATAIHLATKGWPVWATARRPETIADLADKGCRTLALDVTDEDSMQAAVKQIGTVGVLVNNAGYGQYGAIETVDMDDVRRQFETNVFGLVRLTQLVLPGMREQRWGKVVNVSSMGGRFTFPGGGFYHASKHAVEAISDALRNEVKPFGVDVIVIEPGTIKTAFDSAVTGNMAQGDGPYAAFNAQVSEKVEAAYKGWMATFAASPDAVAKVIDRAISSRFPKTRYPVTLGARAMLGVKTLLPDKAFDMVVRSQFPPPKP